MLRVKDIENQNKNLMKPDTYKYNSSFITYCDENLNLQFLKQNNN